ncbi:DUF2092 domain-containing protein, partial [Bradyrhizobium sp. UFLA 03-164]|nr:DUF2092 domain-containing protein [Bradyrhizobium uaiense]
DIRIVRRLDGRLTADIGGHLFEDERGVIALCLRAAGEDGCADVEIVFDGKKVTVLGKHIGAYAQADFSGSVDQLIDKMRSEF